MSTYLGHIIWQTHAARSGGQLLPHLLVLAYLFHNIDGVLRW
jgi:hypothetical protein